MWDSFHLIKTLALRSLINKTDYYYHFNGLSSVIVLTDANGAFVESYDYDVFGAPNRASDVNNPHMFTGRRFDSEIGRTIVLKKKGVLAKYISPSASDIPD